MDSKNRQAHATEPSQVSRRSVAKGTAWAVPAITSMTLVPAFAASAQRKQVIITFDAKKHKETIQCVRIPAEATDIRYSIRGGAGGAGPKDSWGERGGSGAEVLGQIHRPGEGTAAAQEFTIWGVAGGYGPTAAWNDNAVEFATGYGNGGPSMGVPYHTSTVSTEQWSERWCHGGGAGSAIAIGGDPEGPGQLAAEPPVQARIRGRRRIWAPTSDPSERVATEATEARAGTAPMAASPTTRRNMPRSLQPAAREPVAVRAATEVARQIPRTSPKTSSSTRSLRARPAATTAAATTVVATGVRLSSSSAGVASRGTVTLMTTSRCPRLRVAAATPAVVPGHSSSFHAIRS